MMCQSVSDSHTMETETVVTDVDELPEHARALFLSVLEASDRLWDRAERLLANPANDDGHPVRASTRYALGLLVRDDPGDRERAAATIEQVLEYQYTSDPSAVYYGTWARDPADFGPMSEPTEWTDYDPNWREFVGTTLAVLLDTQRDRLPPELRERMARAIDIAAAGTLERDVSPGYTNIALMRAYLLHWTADHFGRDGLRRTAEAYARTIHELYRDGETFCEFNSPTYAGVSLNALGQWVSTDRTDQLNRLGNEMEAGLWEQLATFYHADLGILCGPYSRAYGMDTRRSLADYYIWMAARGQRQLDYPESHHTDIPGNYCSALFAVVLRGWRRCPDGARDAFTSFNGPRNVERRVACVDQEVTATAWLGEGAMCGGFAVAETAAIDGREQLHTGTFHWDCGDSLIGWGRIRTPDGTVPTVTARDGTLAIRQPSGDPVVIEVSAPDIDATDLETTAWRLPGRTVTVEDGGATCVVKATASNTLRLHYGPVANGEVEVRLSFE